MAGVFVFGKHSVRCEKAGSMKLSGRVSRRAMPVMVAVAGGLFGDVRLLRFGAGLFQFSRRASG